MQFFYLILKNGCLFINQLMKHQICIFEQQYLCPPPSQPLIRPQQAFFPDDDFELEQLSEITSNAMDEELNVKQTLLNLYFQEYPTCTELISEELPKNKRSMHDMHSCSYNKSQGSLLAKLQIMNKAQLIVDIDQLKDGICDILSLFTQFGLFCFFNIYLTNCLKVNCESKMDKNRTSGQSNPRTAVSGVKMNNYYFTILHFYTIFPTQLSIILLIIIEVQNVFIVYSTQLNKKQRSCSVSMSYPQFIIKNSFILRRNNLQYPLRFL